MPEPSKEEIKQRWQRFFDEPEIAERIRAVAEQFPNQRSVYIDYHELEVFDPEFLSDLMDSPHLFFRTGEEAILDNVPAEIRETVERHPIGIHLRLKNAPRDAFVDIRDIRHNHVDRLISITGIVKRASAVRPRLLRGVFRCRSCGHRNTVDQDPFSPTMKEPIVCVKEEGGCGRNRNSTTFALEAGASDFIDSQTIMVQESMEGLRGGAQPQNLNILLEDDLVGLIFPGDRVRINGILRGRPQRRGQEKLNKFDLFLEAISVEQETTDYESVVLTEEDMEAIMELARSPDLVERLRSSIAPNIYGYTEVKEAVVLQLFGGVAKESPGGSRIRGDIHILLIGDPGTAKSQILREVAAIAPRGIYASGKSASAAGLTAAAVKDDASDGRWTLEAGALVLADLGTACIDELDKMSPQDRSSMHEAMEQQTVSVAKAGINATLRCRCSMLGAANPKRGRFNRYDPIVDQIDMPPTLLSRFDLIFVLTDIPGDKDAEIADHILMVHQVGEARKQREKKTLDTSIDMDELEEKERRTSPPVDKDLLRKYISYAKDNVFPVLTQEAMAAIRDFYLHMRELGRDPENAIPITARQLEGLIRLSESSARMRLSPRVEEEDVKRALSIMNYYLKQLAEEGGEYDIDRIMSPYSHKQRGKALDLRNMLMEMIKEEPGGVPEKELFEKARERGFSDSEVEKLLGKLNASGEIYKSREGKYKVA
ncbi:MAG: minichromosome maintenance protein MCM [Thermoplasmata archaeon]|nr:minichromosome maintenance protein MCM [Thermoplasmata archaeon]